MKTITVIAYNRPAYLRRTLDALSKCRGLCGYVVYISVDDSDNQPETMDVARSFRFAFKVGQGKRHGVNLHPAEVYGVFDGIIHSDFNVCLEDDIVPSPDALELCDWFYRLPTRDEYACLSLHSQTATQANPLRTDEVMRFSPWGWAMTRAAWENIFKPEWNCKVKEPRGWDWSCGYVMQRQGLKALRPHLSRTLNIGREGGTYETPAHWDQWAAHLVASDGTHGKDYFIGDRIVADPANAEDWVKKEAI